MSDELFNFTCDCCSATYTGKPHELGKLGWVRHQYPRHGQRCGEFLMCRECESFFAPAWARKKVA